MENQKKAKQIHDAIVASGVPKACWMPPDVRYSHTHCPNWSEEKGCWFFGATPAHTNTIESMIVGSMIHWLIGEGFHTMHWDAGETDSIDPSLTIPWFNEKTRECTDQHFSGSSTVEILAKACAFFDKQLYHLSRA